MSTGMILDGVFASEAIDSSGEILDIEGLDCSDFEEGRGVANYEHKDSKDANGEEIVGKVVASKKIFKLADCEDDRQREYWNKVKLPFLYGKVRLYDGAGHEGAKALAAQIRDHHANQEPILVRFSIEGSTLSKEGNRLKTSIARRVALTLRPCNKTCDSGLVADPNAPAGFDKTPEKEKETQKSALSEFLSTRKDELEHPGLSKLGGNTEIECDPWVQEPMQKTLTAGMPTGAPGTLTGGAALQREEISGYHRLKNQVKAAIRDYDKYEHGDVRKFLKHRLPDADPSFIDRFADLVEDYEVKKSQIRKNLEQVQEPKAPKAKKPMTPEPAAEKPKAFPQKEWKMPEPAPTAPKAEAPKSKPKERTLSEDKKGIHNPNALRYSVNDCKVDEETGILHSWGTDENKKPVALQHKIHTYEDDPEYMKIINNHEGKHTDLHDMMERAINNWKIAHELIKNDQLPDEYATFSGLNAAMSSNEAVPTMERAMAHYMDIAGKHGWDPAKGRMPGEVRQDMEAAFQSRKMPGFGLDLLLQNPEGHINAKPAEGGVENHDNAGLIGTPRSKLGGADLYYKLHQFKMDLIKKHRKQDGTVDGQAVMRDLLKQKVEWEKRKTQKTNENKKLATEGKYVPREIEKVNPKTGKVTKQKEWLTQEHKHEIDGVGIEFLDTKTLRYDLGMMGVGDIVVPDTHYIRHTFGKELGDEELGHLRDVLTNSNNTHIMEAMDRFHNKHHPAHKLVKQKYFDGQDTPESRFAGFWHHWVTINPHERAIGRATKGENETTDHSLIWAALGHYMHKHNIPLPKGMDFMIKSEEQEQDEEHPMPVRIAFVMEQLRRHFGEGAALMAYWAVLHPAMHQHSLLEAQKQTPEAKIRKMESMVIELRKAVGAIQSQFPGDAGNQAPPHRAAQTFNGTKIEPQKRKRNEIVDFNGRKVKPGIVHGKGGKMRGRKFQLVHDTPTHIFVKDPDAGGQIRKWKKAYQGSLYKIVKPVEYVEGESHVVDSKKHSLAPFSEHPEQHAMVHGIDFGKKPIHMKHTRSGVNASNSEWRIGGHGKPVYVKESHAYRDNDTNPDVRSEAIYYKMARFMDMGHYVPHTTVIEHPHTGVEHAVIDGIENGQHFNFDDSHKSILNELGNNGELDKLAMMNLILGNHDRHDGNYLMVPSPTDKGPRIRMIDHGLAFSGNYESFQPPRYLERYHNLNNKTLHYEKVHPAAISWAQKLNPEQIGREMLRHGATKQSVKDTLVRLKNLQYKIQRDGAKLTRGNAIVMGMDDPDVQVV